MAWFTGGGGAWWNPTQKIRDITDELTAQKYTNEDPGAFWGQAGQIVAGGNRQFEDFWNKNYNRYMQQYLQAAENPANQGMQLDDWLTGAVANDVNTQFQLQAPQARGVDKRLYDAGRFDTSY